MPGATIFFWWVWRRKRQLWARFIAARLLASLTASVSTERQKARMGLIVAAVALLLVVLARPQMGFSWEEAHSRGLDIVVAIDTSRSMLAADVPPNRLRRVGNLSRGGQNPSREGPNPLRRRSGRTNTTR